MQVAVAVAVTHQMELPGPEALVAVGLVVILHLGLQSQGLQI
jgi:hypothetical protein